MEVITSRGSLLTFWPIGPLCRNPSSSLSAGPCGRCIRRRRRRNPLLVCNAHAHDPHGSDEPLDVIGIGSRKDSIIDFCLVSPAATASRFRFWCIYSSDKKKIQLLERRHNKDLVIRSIEFPLAQQSWQPATILVASAGHDFDHIAAADLLYNVKSVGGLAVAIVLKPFSFEGQRRHKEVNDLVNELKWCSNFYVVVEVDTFLKAEVRTLAEALESANGTVLLAMNAISSMISKIHSYILCTSDGRVKDVKPSEIVKVLERFGEMKIYRGAGYSVNAAMLQAISYCPLLRNSLEDFNGLAIVTIASACNVSETDMSQIIRSFRRISDHSGDIIFSKMYEPKLEPNLIVVTLLLACNNAKTTRNTHFLSSLLQTLPFIRSFQVNSMESSDAPSSKSFHDAFASSVSEITPLVDLNEVACPFELIPSQDAFPGDLENVILRNESCHESTGEVAKLAETNHESICKCGVPTTPDQLGFAMVEQSSEDIGSAFNVTQLWAKKCSASKTKRTDIVDPFSLPDGVKYLKFSPLCTSYSNHALAEDSDFIHQEVFSKVAADTLKNQSLLSARAAMMLEADRKSQKTWNPVVVMIYRGGIYRGRCQGGLPEGKGRFTSLDGSFYEGFWKCGKRSGLGTFCYSNGNIFRGTWRNDLMHGKHVSFLKRLSANFLRACYQQKIFQPCYNGWFYFYTGERWFANFWRGKANGEGRFFSKNGDAFFGLFRDNRRHGKGISVDVDGSRWAEVWDNGVLFCRTPLSEELTNI